MKRIAFFLAAASSITAAAREQLWFATFRPDPGFRIEFKTAADRMKKACPRKDMACLRKHFQPKRWKLTELRAVPDPTSAYTARLEAVLKIDPSRTAGLDVDLSVTTYSTKKERLWRVSIGDWDQGLALYVADFRRDWIRLPEWLSPQETWARTGGEWLNAKGESAAGKLIEIESELKGTNRKNGQPATVSPGVYFIQGVQEGKVELRAGQAHDRPCGGTNEKLTPALPEGTFEIELDSFFPGGIVRFHPLPKQGC